jgi:hypothetical protein
MGLHSFASGLHGLPVLGEKGLTPKGVRATAASLGRDANAHYTGKMVIFPNSVKIRQWVRFRNLVTNGIATVSPDARLSLTGFDDSAVQPDRA